MQVTVTNKEWYPFKLLNPAYQCIRKLLIACPRGNAFFSAPSCQIVMVECSLKHGEYAP